ncbi:MAG: glycosyltransferase family 2 protein [Candidatus Woesearchaeota archaeon]|nr:glycosyltransferase family 2 protein [Candidatus Woesearchaeota archaeon]
MNVWVVIAAFNEEKHLGNVLKETKKYAKNIVVVDDGSRDKTSAIAKDAGVDVIALKQNQGKGFALRTGCDYAVKKGADVIVSLDADGQHPPAYIPKLLKTLEKEKTDIVFTKRSGDMPFSRAFGNWVLNSLMRILFGRKQKDMLCGFMVYTPDAYKKIRWNTNRYEVEAELTAKCLTKKLHWAEIQIPSIYHEKGKGVKLSDAISIAFFIVWLRLTIRKDSE